MTELIKITTNESGNQVVSARELHKFLEVETRFNDWISRMMNYGFVENVDYQVLLKNEYNLSGGRPSTDYALTLDTAKEISMIQRSEKGKLARQYFIECEKRLREIVVSNQQPVLPLKNQLQLNILNSAGDENQVLHALLEYEKQYVKPLELENEAMKPKAEFYDIVADSTDTFTMNEVAKNVNIKGLGRNKMFAFLRYHKILMLNNDPYQKYVDAGYFRSIQSTWIDKSNGRHIYFKTVVFQKGIEFIAKIAGKYFDPNLDYYDEVLNNRYFDKHNK
jgi:major structural protein